MESRSVTEKTSFPPSLPMVLSWSCHHSCGLAVLPLDNLTVGVCVDEGWFQQPHLAQSKWTLGMGEAAHLLHIKGQMTCHQV